MSYCDYCENLPKDNLHRIYHDSMYGFPIESDNELFGRFLLEINQAGLSWDTILKKEVAFRKAFDNFDISKVAKYNEKDIERLLNDAGIIRNRLKINAAIHNASAILALQEKHGSFKTWLEQQNLSDLSDWVKLFKKHFKFVGNEIVNEFLMSSGYLKGAHNENCIIFDKIIKSKPQWLK
ncbi:MAG: DNA-3-methyladenine glycosylase I [Crocinitomicaceae bacterium]|nr:DNA-3-methyladenine glycosylase I [Crocinitomicaceae bacterium]